MRSPAGKRLRIFRAFDPAAPGVPLVFQFNTQVRGVVNRAGAIAGLDYSHASAPESTHRLGCDLLVKCLGAQPDAPSRKLLRAVDARRVFAAGWAASGCRGDLSRVILGCVALAREVAQLASGVTADLPDILPHLKGLRGK